MVHSASPARIARRGAILLVVILLLMLFAVVALSFVLYANSEAKSARIFRESASLPKTDVEPELLLGFFLRQLIYDRTYNVIVQVPVTDGTNTQIVATAVKTAVAK